MTKTIRQKNYFASIGNRHGNHGQNIGDLGDPTLVDMLVMGMSGLISTFHCVTTESFPRSVEVTRKGKRKVASKTAALLCAVQWKAPDSFSICLSWQQTNKQTSTAHCCPDFQFVTILLWCRAGSQAWANPLSFWNTNKQANLSLNIKAQSSLSSRAQSKWVMLYSFVCFRDSLLVVTKTNKWTKQKRKKKKMDHRSPAAVLAAGRSGQRRDVRARHWEDGHPATEASQKEKKNTSRHHKIDLSLFYFFHLLY